MPKKKVEETIKEELKEDLNKNLKEEILEELNTTIDAKIKASISTEIEKINKKIIKAKNRKIFFKNVIIIVLLAIIIYLLYLLKTANYFDKYFIPKNKESEVVEVEKEKQEEKKPVEVEKKPTLNELKEKYASLLDNYYLSESSNYLENFYDGNLIKEIKQYMALNSVKAEDLNIEDNYNIISNNEFKTLYEKLFNDEYVPINFEYNDNNVRYISKIESYITDKLITKEKSSIIREITKIEETKDTIVITTVEGLKRENKIFNIITKEEVCEESSMLKNTNKLNSLTYTFNKNKQLLNLTNSSK